MIFTRGRDVTEYIALLERVVDNMGKDLYSCAVRNDEVITLDDVYESYFQSAKGPTVLEGILIDRGSITKEEITENRLMRSVLCL